MVRDQQLRPQEGNQIKIEGYRLVDGERYYVKAQISLSMDTYLKSSL